MPFFIEVEPYWGSQAGTHTGLSSLPYPLIPRLWYRFDTSVLNYRGDITALS